MTLWSEVNDSRPDRADRGSGGDEEEEVIVSGEEDGGLEDLFCFLVVRVVVFAGFCFG